MKKEFHLTKTGMKELKSELKDLSKRRRLVAKKLKIAREFGDLSENTEYHAAREEQVQVEGRISEIENILKNVEIIKTPKNKSLVQLGSTVFLNSNGQSRTLTIVGSVEANPIKDKISDESPIGKALLGKKVGETITNDAPNGSTLYTIKEIK